ncbi:translation initiation factor [bacterium]|nr:translation initiation factor [bacterium]
MSKNKRRDGLVYSTGPVRSEPESEPSGTGKPSGSSEAVLRIEKKGRRGKTVTLVELRNTHQPRAKEIGRKLKSACGVGGTTRGLVVEVQGDQRDAVRPILEQEGFRVRGG